MRAMSLGLGLVVLTAGCQRQEQYTQQDLVKTLKEHGDPDMRGWAAQALGRVAREEAAASVPPLTEALKDPHENVRMAAAYALADLGKQAASAVPALKKLDQDRAVSVRQAAAYAVKQIQRQK